MTIQNTNEPTDSSKSVKSTDQLATDRLTQTRIRVRISKELHEEPVISRLVSHYGVTVNIAAALLSANARDDRWFDLELQGKSSQIQSALTYLDLTFPVIFVREKSIADITLCKPHYFVIYCH